MHSIRFKGWVKIHQSIHSFDRASDRRAVPGALRGNAVLFPRIDNHLHHSIHLSEGSFESSTEKKKLEMSFLELFLFGAACE